MSTEYFKIYQDKNIQLTESLFIHSALIPKTMNRYLEELGYVIDENPMTWKYYHNIAGEYHFRDIEMIIKSHDTLEDIVFSKENMAIHKGTYSDYLTNANYVNSLKDKYPDQELLINGILSPIDPVLALNSEDGTVLNYNYNLVEDNEIDLIQEIQTYVKHYFRRRGVDRHAITDDLAITSFYATLYGFLPSVISNIRKSKCLTRQVNSYHVREYLKSNGELDKYLDVLNLEQRLYLYKNIQYIRKNAGKKSTLDELVKNLMTAINMPLSTYDLKHNRLADGSDSSDVYFLRKPYNYIDIDRNDNRYEVKDVLNKQEKIAVFNKQWQDDEEELLHKHTADANNELKTKVLESNMLDLGEASPYTLERSLIDYWFYFTSLGLYDAYITVPSPSGTEDLSLNVKDAAILAIYCALRAQGIEPINIPKYNLKAVRRITIPTWEQVRSISMREAVDDSFIDITMFNIIDITSYHSVLSFRDAATQLHKRLQFHRISIGLYGNPIRAVNAYNSVMSLYRTHYVDIGNDLYTDWLSDRSIVLEDLDNNEYALLYEAIVKECIGTPNDERTLADIQKGIVELISQLSSYNVQFITKINETPIIFTDRIGNAPMRRSMGLRIHDYILKNGTRYPSTHMYMRFKATYHNPRTLNARATVRRSLHKGFIDNGRTLVASSKPKFSGAIYTNQRIVLY